MRGSLLTRAGTLLIVSLMVLAAGCNNAAGPPSTTNATDDGLYCKEHGVPEKFCTLCHEDLKTKLVLCKEHGGIPEDICTLCHPEVEKQHNIVMCPNGHGLPRHFCARCAEKPAA